MHSIAQPLLLAFALLTAGAAAGAPAPPAAAAPGYPQLVDAVIARYRLPGLAVGVIEHGQVAWKHTYGDLPSGAPMNADTLFELGSTTKAMTVTLLARLAQAGKLHWSAPVTRYLPGFRMYDPWVTGHMQVADLLEHHSGLHGFAGDLMLWPHPSRFTPEDVVHALRYLKPAYGFRAGYAYDNVLYVTAGEVAAAAGGAPYAQLLRREVFQPLGMRRCQIGTWNRDEVGNVARPHVRRDGRFVPVPARGAIARATTMEAAGGVSCGLDDMLTWALNWLAPTPEELQWLTPRQREAEWTPYTPVPISARRREWNGTRIFSVGRGWFISNPDDHLAVWHTGVLEGMRAAIVLLPYAQSGFVVLMNAGADDALTVLDEVLLQRLAAPQRARPVAWYADSLARYDAAERVPAPPAPAAEPATPAMLALRLGTWRDPWFGVVRLCARGDRVHFASRMSPLLRGEVMRAGSRYLVHWKDDAAPDAWLDFPAHAGGTLHMALVDPDADASSDFRDLAFTRTAGCPAPG